MAWYPDYAPTKPKSVKGGIKSKAKSTDNWWSKQWYEFMETFNLGARLARGKTYARKGQVIDVSVEPGLVTAKVQGSRSTPYRVTIHFEQISSEGWDRIVERLREQALFAARLLSGEVPQELEQFFQDEGASLFPTLSKTSDMDCSCPDWSNPCKHIAAVFYVLGDAFDRDPFLILRLRGMERDKLLERLSDGIEPLGAVEEFQTESEEFEPLVFESFYNGLYLPEDVGPIGRTALDMSLLRRLGDMPFWRGERSLMESLADTYQQASRLGRAVALGEWEEVEGERKKTFSR
jgi:uncharacterized Zn finger protein